VALVTIPFVRGVQTVPAERFGLVSRTKPGAEIGQERILRLAEIVMLNVGEA